MTLIIQKPTGAKLVFAKDFSFDPDAAAYIAAVEAADTQALETATRYAINDFVIGCKQDGIWSAIKASCILAGARTLTGALVPLVGTAPTNFNFVAGDYNRETGLVGDGSTKYLDSNRANNADPQNSSHIATYTTSTASASSRHYCGSFQTSPDSFSGIIDNAGQLNFSMNTTSGIGVSGVGNTLTGFFGVSRSGVNLTTGRAGQSTYSSGVASVAPTALNHFVFCRNLNGTANSISNRRHAFYSIGESLDLALLDTRVSALITAIGAAF
jgi:hypothetical protein